MAQRNQEPPHCSVQIEALFLQLKRLSWKGGQNTSIVCSINEDAIDTWKQEHQFNNCHPTKLQVQMQFLPRFIRLWLPMAEKLTYLLHCMWRKEAIPQEFKERCIHNWRGNPQVCATIEASPLLGRYWQKILLNFLNFYLDQTGLIPESQCGFRKDKRTIDTSFTARQLQEKCQEQNVDLYMAFVDLSKAFDTVSRDGLWKTMANFGCPPRFIAMVRHFMMTCRHVCKMMESSLSPLR